MAIRSTESYCPGQIEPSRTAMRNAPSTTSIRRTPANGPEDSARTSAPPRGRGKVRQLQSRAHQLQPARLDAASEKGQRRQLDVDPVGGEARAGADLDPVADHRALDRHAGQRQQLKPHGTVDPQVGAARFAQEPRQLAA